MWHSNYELNSLSFIVILVLSLLLAYWMDDDFDDDDFYVKINELNCYDDYEKVGCEDFVMLGENHLMVVY